MIEKIYRVTKIVCCTALAAMLVVPTFFCQLNGMTMAANRVVPVTLECSICFTDTNDGVRLSCGHAFCKGCLKRIVDDAVREKSTLNLVCPAAKPRCAKALTIEEVRVITDNDSTTNWHASILDREILLREHGGQPCPGRPGRNCTAVLMRTTPDEAQITRCDECERPYCNACFLPGEAHTGVNCARAQERYAQSNEASPEDKATLELLRNVSKPCPRCNNAVEKNNGCNHMTCRCGHHFCWECRADWINCGHQCAQVSQAQRTGWGTPAPAADAHWAIPQPTTVPIGVTQAAAMPAAAYTNEDRQREADRELAQEDGQLQQQTIDLLQALQAADEEEQRLERQRIITQYLAAQERARRAEEEQLARARQNELEIARENARARQREEQEQLARQQAQRAQLQQQAVQPAALALAARADSEPECFICREKYDSEARMCMQLSCCKQCICRVCLDNLDRMSYSTEFAGFHFQRPVQNKCPYCNKAADLMNPVRIDTNKK